MDSNQPFLTKVKDDKQVQVQSLTFKDEPTDKPQDENLYFQRQVLAGGTMLLFMINSTMTAGFTGILFPQLQEPDSIIKLTKEEESWIAAVLPLVMAIGCIFGAWTMEKLGRKNNHIACSVLAMISWGVVYYSKTVTTLLIGRILCGLYCGLSGMSLTAYLAEMASTKYRSVALSLIGLGVAAGVLFVHFLGTYLTWQDTAVVAMLLPIGIIVLLAYLPESHVWLLNKNKVDEARKSFNWFRGNGEAEIEEFEKLVEESSGKKLSLAEKLQECKKPEFYRPLSILILVFVTSQSTGSNVVTFYSVYLMQMTVPSLNRYAAMLIVDSGRVIMSVACSFLMKRYRVRTLLLTTAAGTVLSLFALSFFVYMATLYPENKVYTVIPLLFLMTYIISVSCGYVPLPWSLCGELLPPVTKGIGGGIGTAINFFGFFVVIKTGPFLMDSIGMHGTFALYGLLVLVGSTGIYFVLPETKDRSLQEIQELFKAKEHTLNFNMVEKPNKV